MILEKKCIRDIYKKLMSQEYFHRNKSSISIFVKKWEEWIELYALLWCMTKQNLLDQVIACVQFFTIWWSSVLSLEWHVISLPFFSGANSWIRAHALNRAGTRCGLKHWIIWSYPWIDKNKSYCWTCQSLWILIASSSSLTCSFAHLCVLQHIPVILLCWKTSVQSNGWIWSFWNLKSKISVTMAKLKQVSRLRDNIRCFLFEVHGDGILLIQHHQCFHQDRNCDQPKK